MNAADTGMGLMLRALRRAAGSSLLDRLGLREQVERAVLGATKTGFRTAGAAGRTFAAASRLAQPARLRPAERRGLFDLTPTEEQQMLREAVSDFAQTRLRPGAHEADAASAAPPELLEQGTELGLSMLGVPEELGGAQTERSAVTAVLAAEALAQGDMGLALAMLAPNAVAGALTLWGDADQQATYLPPFSGDYPPAAALALLEPRPLFDPLAPECAARSHDGGYELRGAKSLTPRAADAELFVIGARLPDGRPGLFLVESRTAGVFVEPEPAMGLRAAATGRLSLEGVKLPAAALLGEGRPEVYSECVALSRVGWCALAVGTARAVLDYVVPYVNERIAFGEPVSHRQSVAFAVADIGIELESMRLATYRAAARADRGDRFAREAALARRLCGEKGVAIGSMGVQLLGGHGYVKEHPVERWYRDLRAAGLMEGALLV